MPRIARVALIIVAVVVIPIVTVGLLARVPIAQQYIFGAELNPLRPGRAFDLEKSFYAGADYSLLIFWKSDCAACKATQPFVSQIQNSVDKHKARQVVMIEAAGSEDQPSQESSSVRPASVMLSASYVERLGVSNVPMFIVLGRDGVIRLVHVGAVTQAESASVEHEILSAMGISAQ